MSCEDKWLSCTVHSFHVIGSWVVGEIVIELRACVCVFVAITACLWD